MKQVTAVTIDPDMLSTYPGYLTSQWNYTCLSITPVTAGTRHVINTPSSSYPRPPPPLFPIMDIFWGFHGWAHTLWCPTAASFKLLSQWPSTGWNEEEMTTTSETGSDIQYDAVNFFQNTPNRHPIVHLWGQAMGSHLWIQSLVYDLPL